MLILKTFTSYFILGLLAGGVILAFVSATNYMQLAIATVLYPLLTLFAYKVFKGGSLKVQRLPVVKHITEPIEDVKKEEIEVDDINKRTFLKIIGATGISFLFVSMFGRPVQSLLSGQSFMQNPLSAPSSALNQPVTPTSSPTDGYNISEIDEGIISYYGFVNKSGGWFIMKGDSNTGSFRYTKGNANFPINWNNREDLKYDYFHEVFTSE